METSKASMVSLISWISRPIASCLSLQYSWSFEDPSKMYWAYLLVPEIEMDIVFLDFSDGGSKDGPQPMNLSESWSKHASYLWAAEQEVMSPTKEEAYSARSSLLEFSLQIHFSTASCSNFSPPHACRLRVRFRVSNFTLF